MITADEARKISEANPKKKKARKWNIFDSLQLNWFQFLIKNKSKRGDRRAISFFKARNTVFQELKKAGYSVTISSITVIDW